MNKEEFKALEILTRIKGHFNPDDIVNKELFEEDFTTLETLIKRVILFKKIIKRNKISFTLVNYPAFTGCNSLEYWNAGYESGAILFEDLNKKESKELLKFFDELITEIDY